MSESNYWQIKIEVRSKDGSSLPSEKIQSSLTKALRKYSNELGVEEYPEDLDDILRGFELDGDRYSHYTALMDNLNSLKDWLDENPKYGVRIIEINDYVADRDE